MATLGNTPKSTTVLRLEARKSFTLSVWITDHHGRALDISTISLRLVVKQRDLADTGVDDLAGLVLDQTADLTDPLEGLATFSVQASDLNQAPGEYPFSLVMLDEGYSAVLMKGVVDLQENSEFSSVGSTYLSSNPASSIVLSLRGRSVVSIATGSTLAPGTTSFTDGDKAKLDSITTGAEVNIPADWTAGVLDQGYILNKPLNVGIPDGGSPGEVMAKLSGVDGDAAWVMLYPDSGTNGLNATGVADGLVPVANGLGSWSWAPVDGGVTSVNTRVGDVVLDMGDLADTAARVAFTPAERLKLAAVETSIDWDDVQNRPSLGTAAAADLTSLIQKGQINAATDFQSGVTPKAFVPRLSELRGFTHGTGIPSGGADGDVYFQYTV